MIENDVGPTGPQDEPNPYDHTGTAAEGVPSQEARTWAMLCHLMALSLYFSGFGGIVGPLVVWLLKKDEHPLVDDQGKESLNFQISMFIYHAIALMLVCFVIGFPMLIAISIVNIVMIIIAAVRANNGEYYRYPLTIRFLK